MLCLYGARNENERAMDILKILKTWVQDSEAKSSEVGQIASGANKHNAVNGSKVRRSAVSETTIALAHHALGVCHFYWSHWTHESSSRGDLRKSAVSTFRQTLQLEVEETFKLELLYSLAYTLADNRQNDAAIKIARSAVSIELDDDEAQLDLHPYRRNLLLKSWHLLALLLSSREKYAAGSTACDAAFDLYEGKESLHDHPENSAPESSLRISERQGLLELRMTQIALLEILHGPEEAVNAAGDLLGLYHRLFSGVSPKTSNFSTQLRPPSPTVSAAGTQRSFRGSFLGHPKDRRSRLQLDGQGSNSVSSLEPTQPTAPPAPAIAITSENVILPHETSHQQSLLGRQESNKLRKRSSRKSMGSQRRNRTVSPSKRGSSDGGYLLPTLGGRSARSSLEDPHPPSTSHTYALGEVGVAITHNHPSNPATPIAAPDPPNPLQDIPSTTQNMASTNPNPNPIPPQPSPFSLQPPPIATAPDPLTLIPEPLFPPALAVRHSLTLLNKIWLFISALYRRSSLYAESTSAIREATGTVQAMQASIASLEGSSESSFSTTPCGGNGLKALSELWADVYAETAALQIAKGSIEKAEASYEIALGWWPNHANAVIGLAEILLDQFEDAVRKQSLSSPPLRSKNKDKRHSTKTPRPQPPQQSMIDSTETSSVIISSSSSSSSPSPTPPTSPTLPPQGPPHQNQSQSTSPLSPYSHLDLPLSALAARDRAYMLLSTLTKSGDGWDNAEAWYGFGRALECSRMTDRALEAFEWVVELEEGRPVREWRSCGGL